MSTTVANLPRMSAASLSSLLLSHSPTFPSNIAIIDVRDDDHIGGHIRGSTNVPSAALDYSLPSLARNLQDKDTVIFHCALSQQRGPSAALRYMRERERLLGPIAPAGETVGQAMKKSKVEGKGKGDEEAIDEEDKEWEDESDETRPLQQTVYVLDRGFAGWQEKYGEDRRLTEGYVKDLWNDH